MESLSVLFKSGLSAEEVQEKFEERADRYRQVEGLLQKYYVKDEATGHFGGIYVFDSQESLGAFRGSDLAKSIGDTYQYLGPPEVRELQVTLSLYEEKERLRA